MLNVWRKSLSAGEVKACDASSLRGCEFFVTPSWTEFWIFHEFHPSSFQKISGVGHDTDFSQIGRPWIDTSLIPIMSRDIIFLFSAKRFYVDN